MVKINYRRIARHFAERRAREAERAAIEAYLLTQRDHYGPPQVLRSAAGWYIGTLFWDAQYQYWSPGSRDSGYYPTKEAAEVDLPHYLG